MNTHRLKFQALVTPARRAPDPAGSPPPDRTVFDMAPGQMQRMAVRCEHHQTHATGFFNALVSSNGDEPGLLGNDHAVVTITITGDEPAEYLGVGDYFALWRGHDIAVGVITRRLFT